MAWMLEPTCLQISKLKNNKIIKKSSVMKKFLEFDDKLLMYLI
jgi:hypothetical protein